MGTGVRFPHWEDPEALLLSSSCHGTFHCLLPPSLLYLGTYYAFYSLFITNSL